MRQSLPFTIFLLLIHLSLFSQTKISGIVRDAETKTPLFGASIFAPQTTNGGATDESGLFAFTLAEGQTQVLISYVGYESVIVPASSFTGTDKANVVYMNPTVNKLKEVVIKKISAKQREKYMAIFNREFIGLGKIAEKTKILNPEVLQFNMNNENTLLTVTADAPIQLINEKTGYFISYELVYFENKILPKQNNQMLTTYFGYPFFKDIVLEKKLNPKRVAKTRFKCYKGSTMHFIRSLYHGTMEEEGFYVQKFKQELNLKYPGDEAIKKLKEAKKYDPAFLSSLPAKYISTYDEATSKVHQLVFERETKKYFYFPDFLFVSYTKEGEESLYGEQMHYFHKKAQLSHFQLLEDKPIEIYADGNYSNIELLANFGYMGWKKMGEILPFDYQPEQVVND